MNPILIIAAFGCLLSPLAEAHSDLEVKVTKLDGLSARLLELGAVSGIAAGDGPVDLAPQFEKMGIEVPEGASIIYGSGVLICNLDARGHELVQTVIESIFLKDNLIASYKLYYKLLEPLSKEDRLRAVMRIGFVPDPLVAEMIREISRLREVKQAPDPFDELPFQPQPLTQEELDRIKDLEATTSRLLEIAMERLKLQLTAIDDAAKHNP